MKVSGAVARRKGVLLAAVALAASWSVAQNTVTLVKDFGANSDPFPAEHRPVAAAEIAAGVTLYLDSDSDNDGGLWRRDASGSRLLRGFGAPLPGTGRSAGNLGPEVGLSSSTFEIYSAGRHGIAFAGRYFFAGRESDEQASGTELWSSDGSHAGTVLLKDLWEGSGSGLPHGFVPFGGQLYFAATRTNGAGHKQAVLWRSDGTAAGTQPAFTLDDAYSFDDLTVANGRLYFTVNFGQGSFGNGFGSSPAAPAYSSDGTAVGTVALSFADGSPLMVSSSFLAATDGLVYACNAKGIVASNGLGTASQAYAEENSSSSGSGGSSTSSSGSTSSSSGSGGSSTSSSTSSGGGPTTSSSSSSSSGGFGPGSPWLPPGGFGVVNPPCTGLLASGPAGIAYFGRSNGNSIRLLKDGAMTVLMSGATAESPAVAFDGQFYFYSYSSGTSGGLARIDLRNAGGAFTRVQDFRIRYGDRSAYSYSTGLLQVRNGRLQFLNSDQDATPGLYAIAASGAAPQLLTSQETEFVTHAGVQPSAPPFPRPNTAYLGADFDAGLTNVGLDAEPPFRVLRRQVVGTANRLPEFGPRTFISDGTAAGTRFVRDGGLARGSLAIPGGGVISYADDDGHLRLEFVDGAGARTVIEDLSAQTFFGGADFPLIAQLTWAGGRLLYSAPAVIPYGDGEDERYFGGAELHVWQPGQPARRVKRFGNENGSSPGISRRSPMAALGSKVLFLAMGEDAQPQLWISDGTEAGTTPVEGNVVASYLDPLGVAGGRVIYEAAEDFGVSYTRKVFATDGTAAGTELLLDNPGTLGGDNSQGGAVATGYTPLLSSRGVNLDGVLVFGFATEVGGKELWRTDGTAAGTDQVADLRPGAVGSNPDGFVATGDGLAYFAANGGNGRELWKTDGTAAGTVQVSDLVAGLAGSNPGSLSWQPDLRRLVFSAEADGEGRELYVADGATVTPLASFTPGIGSGNPNGTVRIGTRLVLAASDGATGEELYSVALDGATEAAPTLAATAVTLGEAAGTGRMKVTLDAPSPATVRVAYASADGRATAGADYGAVAGELSFAPGETEKGIDLPVLDDPEAEGDEGYEVRFYRPSGATLATPTAAVTVADDDGAVQSMMLMSGSGDVVTLSIDRGSIAAAQFVPVPDDAPDRYAYPYGFLALDLADVPEGEAVQVTLQLPGSPSARPPLDSFVKCLPAACGAYANALVSDTGGGAEVSFTLYDGGPGDADGIANGQIADPGAPALATRLEPFTLFVRSGVAMGTVITSEAITVAGNVAATQRTVRIGNGQYSINNGAWTNSPGTLHAGDRIAVRHVSASTADTTTDSVLDVGGDFTVRFRSVTTAADRVPDAFGFASQSNVTAGGTVTSNAVTPVGYNVSLAVVPGPGVAFSVNGGAFTTARGTLKPGDTLKVQHTASTTKQGYTKSSIKVGETTGTFVTRTK